MWRWRSWLARSSAVLILLVFVQGFFIQGMTRDHVDPSWVYISKPPKSESGLVRDHATGAKPQCCLHGFVVALCGERSDSVKPVITTLKHAAGRHFAHLNSGDAKHGRVGDRNETALLPCSRKERL